MPYFLSCCGSVDKTTDSHSWGPQFESTGSGNSAFGQGTLSGIIAQSLGKDFKPLVPWLLAYEAVCFLSGQVK